MITADGGGSNGHRVRQWKIELQEFANEFGIPITVCHLPPVTSKWNKIEHRLFSFITINWRGKPLRTFKTIVQLIQVDIGFGDAVYPEPEFESFPVLLPMEPPVIRAYPREAVIAEKLNADAHWDFKLDLLQPTEQANIPSGMQKGGGSWPKND